ncbi:MAG: hypothetical protein C0432_00180 [Candidatus Puniceispirillum sp.]|nr:hypothetical protein [Candidatus Pelagibacter sp.]MBA4282700.1 hypothetical protein [Candidatus Puniceispirillum sp.]
MLKIIKKNIRFAVSLSILHSVGLSSPCSDYCKQFNKIPSSEYDNYQFENDRKAETAKRCQSAPLAYYINDEGRNVLCAKCDWYGNRVMFRTTNFCKPKNDKVIEIVNFDQSDIRRKADQVGISHQKGSLYKGQLRGKNTGSYYNDEGISNNRTDSDYSGDSIGTGSTEEMY